MSLRKKSKGIDLFYSFTMIRLKREKVMRIEEELKDEIKKLKLGDKYGSLHLLRKAFFVRGPGKSYKFLLEGGGSLKRFLHRFPLSNDFFLIC